MNKILLCLIFLNSWLIATEYTKLETKGKESFLEALRENVKEVRTLACKFEQEKRLDMFDDVFKLNGWAFIKKNPKSIRWEYSKPLKKVVLINGDEMKVFKWRKKKRKRIINPNEKYIKLAYEYILSFFDGDFSQSHKSFHLSIYKKKNGSYKLIFNSKGELKKYIQSIQILIAKDIKTIKKVSIYESKENYTDILFIEIQHNVKLKHDIFTGILIEKYKDGFTK